MKTSLHSLPVLILSFLLTACGETGSEPDQFSEVQYRVTQAGGGTFTLLRMASGGRERRLSSNRVYTTRGAMHFAVEGAPGPYIAEFCRRSGGEMTVNFIADSSNLPGQVQLQFESAGQAGVCRAAADLCTTAATGNACQGDTDCASGELCEKRLPVVYPSNTDTHAVLPVADPDVRFEVCSPISGTSCSASGDPATSIFGRATSGSVGDISSTYLVSDETPAIYFLHSARANVSGIFRAAADEFLQAQLFVNDSLSKTEANTHDVVLRTDI